MKFFRLQTNVYFLLGGCNSRYETMQLASQCDKAFELLPLPMPDRFAPVAFIS